MENQKEIWKDIPNYEGYYQASNLGRIKSLKRKYVRNNRIMIPNKDRKGYLRVCLRDNKTKRTIHVHKLIAMAFLNHTPCGYEQVVDHIDGKPLNNNLSNLRVISQRENTKKERMKTSSNYVGVSWHKSSKKWKSYIYIKQKQIYLGLFNNELDAHQAYQNALNNIIKL